MVKNSLFLLLIAVSASFATVRLVPSQYPTIQSAINAAVPHDTVMVAEGIYYENINFIGKNLIIVSPFAQDRNPSHIQNTIIDGSHATDGDSVSVVRIMNHEDSTTVLMGFTLRGGRGTPLIDQDNGLTYVEGGGIMIENAAPVIQFNAIIDNAATRRPNGISSSGGGGIRAGWSQPKILNNLFLRNEGRYGGGIVINFSRAIISNNVFALNSGGQDYGGGGVWANGSGGGPSVLENNTIVGNSSTLTGGGIRVWNGAQMQCRNNIVWANHSNSGATQISGGTHSYSCVMGGFTGTGNISSDPLFADSELFLQISSPCVDAGNPDSSYNDRNFEGAALWPSQGEARNDMGVYGGRRAATFFPFSYPLIHLASNTIDFGDPEIGETATASLMVFNDGASSLRIDSATIVSNTQGDFAILTSLPISITPFGLDSLRLSWHPTLPEPLLADSLRIYHNDASHTNPLTVALIGTIFISADDPNPSLPQTYFLEQNYPNPFNPSTEIKFGVPVQSHVTLKVFNSAGQEVVKLADKTLAAGIYTKLLDGSKLATGEYFYTLEGEGFKLSRKMLLIK